MYDYTTPQQHSGNGYFENGCFIDPRLLMHSNSSSSLTGAGQWIGNNYSITAPQDAYTPVPNVGLASRRCGCLSQGCPQCQPTTPPHTPRRQGGFYTASHVPARTVPGPAITYGLLTGCYPLPPTHTTTSNSRSPQYHQRLRPEANPFSPTVHPRQGSQTQTPSQQRRDSQETPGSCYSRFHQPGLAYYAPGSQPEYQAPSQSPSVLSSQGLRSPWDGSQTPPIDAYPTPPTTVSASIGRRRPHQRTALQQQPGHARTWYADQARVRYGGPAPPSFRQIGKTCGHRPARPPPPTLLKEAYNVGDRLRQDNDPRAPAVTDTPTPAPRGSGQWQCSNPSCAKRRFDTKSDRDHHARIHGPKEFVCEPCGFAAVFEKDWRNHNGTKKHRKKVGAEVAASEASRGKVVARAYCPLMDCAYSKGGKEHGFSRKDHLKRHMKSVHPGVFVPGLDLGSESMSAVPAEFPS